MAEESLDIVKGLQYEALSRLSKEKLMVIISNLQNMSAETVAKISEHIPEYFGICNEAFQSLFSSHKENIERGDRDMQGVIDSLDSTKAIFEKLLNEATSEEQKEKYIKELKEIDEKKEKLRATRERERKEAQKNFVKAALTIIGFAGAAIGVTIKVGKKLY